MNPYQRIADHYMALSQEFRRLGNKESADYYAGMARIFQTRAGEE